MPSTVPGENLPPVRERLQMGTRTCGTVGAVDKEKTSLHVLNVPLTVFPICMTRTKFPGMDHFYRKNGSWGTIFPLKISVRGTKIFRTKIPVTDLVVIKIIMMSFPRAMRTNTQKQFSSLFLFLAGGPPPVNSFQRKWAVAQIH